MLYRDVLYRKNTVSEHYTYISFCVCVFFVNYVLGKDLYNISLVVAQKLWVMDGTVGVTIKYSR